MTERKRGPKKGAGRKWANKLKELGKQPPPQDLVNKINEEQPKKIAAAPSIRKDLDLE
ncbi:MAG: hypothetical protein AB7F86_10020 [Bdellovibrionales bacterium]